MSDYSIHFIIGSSFEFYTLIVKEESTLQVF
jgi:hypothetical protein